MIPSNYCHLICLLVLCSMRNADTAKTYMPNRNVVFILVDDLRPALKSFGDNKAFTPNIDSLADRSFVFRNVYAQQALCAPSRNSLLTSRRPDTLHLYDFYSYWRDFAGNFTTLPQYLKLHGYETYSVGKIFHPGKSSNFTDDYPYSWTQKPYHTKYERYMNAPVCPDKQNPSRRFRNLICPVDVRSQPGRTLPDIDNVRQAKILLNELNDRHVPFFLGVGLHKPHIPFRFPHKYLQYHHKIDKFAEPPFNRIPHGLPDVAFNPYMDIRDRHEVKKLNISFPFGPVPHDLGLRIRQAYYASVTYMDDLVGDLLARVNFTNTIVVLCGDHGWSLGEHAEWAKYSNYDIALRVPLIIYSPDRVRPAAGKREVNALVELLDIFPTIVDLVRLPGLAKCSNIGEQQTCTEGKSLVPHMMADYSIWDGNTFAFSQYPRPSASPIPTSDRPRLRHIRIMGYSIRTMRYRYTLWIQFLRKQFRRVWQRVYGEELYDHSMDQDENINLSMNTQYRDVKVHLRNMLEQKNGRVSTICRITADNKIKPDTFC